MTIVGCYIIGERVGFEYEHTVLPCFKYEHHLFCGTEYEPEYYIVGAPVSFKYERAVLTCFKYEHTSICGFYMVYEQASSMGIP